MKKTPYQSHYVQLTRKFREAFRRLHQTRNGGKGRVATKNARRSAFACLYAMATRMDQEYPIPARVPRPKPRRTRAGAKRRIILPK